MNKTAKAGTRSKTAAKPVKTAAKPVKKRSAGLPEPLKKAFARAAAAGRPFTRSEKELLKRGFVPLDEVEAMAARAVRLIKASKKLSADRKAWALNNVADTLKWARGHGGMAKAGALWLKHAHEPPQPLDMEALKAVRAA